jgi:hypothetical protein
MPNTAKAYISIVLAAGAATLVFAASAWSSANLAAFAALLAFTLFASVLKVRIPGMTGTISPNFIFLLIGMTVFSFSEVIIASFAAALLQSVWRSKSNLQPIQILFSVASLMISGAVAFSISHLALPTIGATSALPLILLAGTLYLSLNTALVSIVVSLVEGRSFQEVFHVCSETVFPYFFFGIVVTGMVSASLTSDKVWQRSALVSPSIVLAYIYFSHRAKIARQLSPSHDMAAADEAELILASSNR